MKKRLLHRGFLTKSGLRKATFTLDSTRWENGREVLGFPKRLPRPNEMSPLALGRGRIYLYADNWAIFRIEAKAILPKGKQTDPLTLHQTQHLAYRLVVQFAPYQGRYYLQSVQYQADYDDYGWGETPRRVQVRASVWMENLQLRPLTEAEYVAKYGAYDQYGAVRVDLRHRQPQPAYDPQFWAGMPPTPHFLVMQRDLEKSRPLARQFAHNHWDNLVSPGDSLAVVRRYSRKYQAFLQNQN